MFDSHVSLVIKTPRQKRSASKTNLIRMKVVTLLFSAAYAQNALQALNLGLNDVLQESAPSQSESELTVEEEQSEITLHRKKYDGIYDPNMYPYGPLHGDYKFLDSDDQASSRVNLPSPFPFFNGQSTNAFRLSTNGLISLDGDVSILTDNPEILPASSIDAPFVAGFWNDIWSKRHGRIYWRLEITNTTLLDEMANDVVNFGIDIGVVKYAFIGSWWQVAPYGADRDSEKNTFQIALMTDGTHSFAIFNYQNIEWSAAEGKDFAIAGFDDNSGVYDMLPGSATADVVNLSTTKTNSNMGGRHILRLDWVPEVETEMPANRAVPISQWPSNDNTPAGGIFEFKPENPIGNGTCTINFPNTVMWFHTFDAHIRVDTSSTLNSWRICAANPDFEPGMDDMFRFIIFFEDDGEFSEDDMSISCDETDEYEYAVYSFPQNALQTDGRTNLRKFGNAWNSNDMYTITLGSAVGNFTVDDPRIRVDTVDQQSFTFTNVPSGIDEIWFSFDYIDYFGSNEVGAV